MTGARFRVLIADGDRRIRRSIRALIETDSTFQLVGEAASVRELQEHRGLPMASVVLVTLSLPSATDGLALVRWLARDVGRAVVVISAVGGVRELALEAGAKVFLDMGCSPDALLDGLRSAGNLTG